jgi:hypothetical protein
VLGSGSSRISIFWPDINPKIFTRSYLGSGSNHCLKAECHEIFGLNRIWFFQKPKIGEFKKKLADKRLMDLKKTAIPTSALYTTGLTTVKSFKLTVYCTGIFSAIKNSENYTLKTFLLGNILYY